MPVTVNEALLFLPAVKVRPLVLPSFSVPFVTESVSDSVLIVPALASVNEMALLLEVEKTSVLFSLSEPFAGAVIAGAVAGETVIPTLLAADWPSVVSSSEIASESIPLNAVDGV